MVTALPRVLVLEDDELMLELYRCQFDMWALPVECTWMSSATDALRDIDSLRPQLLITDLSMPGVDGLEMLQEIESRPHLADMKIVVVSGVQAEVIAEHRRLRAGSQETQQQHQQQCGHPCHKRHPESWQ